MKNKYPYIAIGISILLSIGYFIYIGFNVNIKKWDVSTNYITTILSLVIGAMISIIIYNHQRKKESEQILKELRKNLQAELSDIKRVLKSREGMTVNGMSFLVTFIEPIIIHECAKNSLFSPIDIENFIHISRKIKLYNVQVNFLLSVLSNSNNKNFDILLKHSYNNLKTGRIAIVSDIDLLVKRLNLTLSDSISKA